MNFLWEDYLCHHGIKGKKWGIRRFQNYDGTLINPKKEVGKKAIQIISTPVRATKKVTDTEANIVRNVSKQIVKDNRVKDKIVRKTIESAQKMSNPLNSGNGIDDAGNRITKRGVNIAGQLYEQAVSNMNALAEDNPNPLIARNYDAYKAELERLKQEELESLSVSELDEYKDSLLSARKEFELELEKAKKLPINSKNDADIRNDYIKHYTDKINEINLIIGNVNDALKVSAERKRANTVNWNKPSAKREYANQKAEKQIEQVKQETKQEIAKDFTKKANKSLQAIPTPTNPLGPLFNRDKMVGGALDKFKKKKKGSKGGHR